MGFHGAESSPSMGTCSVVKGLGLEWTQMEQETVWGHWNKVECPLTSTPLSRECHLSAMRGLYVEWCLRVEQAK